MVASVKFRDIDPVEVFAVRLSIVTQSSITMEELSAPSSLQIKRAPNVLQARRIAMAWTYSLMPNYAAVGRAFGCTPDFARDSVARVHSRKGPDRELYHKWRPPWHIGMVKP